MTMADADPGGRILATPSSPKLPLIVCGGIALGIAGLDAAGIEVFPVDLFGQNGILVTYPETPKDHIPGFGTEPIPDMSIVYATSSLTPEEARMLNERGLLNGLTGEDIEINILREEGFAELRRALESINELKAQGLTSDEAAGVLLKQKPHLKGPLLHFGLKATHIGQPVVVVGQNMTGAIHFLPNGDVRVF